MIATCFAQYNMQISAEAVEKLKVYEKLLLKWQKTINLVGPSTLDHIVEKHFIESAQIMNFLHDKNITLADMGSGAGFPGMVLAILGVKNVHLIESDTRKAVFLQNVSRETKTPVTLHTCRVEDSRISGVDVVTARALAPLKDLLGLMQKLSPAYGLFLKGARAEEEIAEARTLWNFTAETHDGLGKILKICFT